MKAQAYFPSCRDRACRCRSLQETEFHNIHGSRRGRCIGREASHRCQLWSSQHGDGDNVKSTRERYIKSPRANHSRDFRMAQSKLPIRECQELWRRPGDCLAMFVDDPLSVLRVALTDALAQWCIRNIALLERRSFHERTLSHLVVCLDCVVVARAPHANMRERRELCDVCVRV